MSLATWEAESYPETAAEAAKRGDLDATKHSLRKWDGLRPENLERHGMVASGIGYHILEQKGYRQAFLPNGKTCALCKLHYKNQCKTCPLTKAREGAACDDRREDEQLSPWSEWTMNHNPEPMIHWLTLAKEHCND